MLNKKYYLIYEVKVENEKQVQAIAADMFDRSGIEPKAILQNIDWDLKKLIDQLKK